MAAVSSIHLIEAGTIVQEAAWQIFLALQKPLTESKFFEITTSLACVRSVSGRVILHLHSKNNKRLSMIRTD